MIHILPVNDLKEHTEDTTCECNPSIKIEYGEIIVIHNSYDKRELNEPREKDFTGVPIGVKSRHGEMLHIGDRIETVQGTKFTVALDINGFVSILSDEDGNYYELKPFMSPNIWKIK